MNLGGQLIWISLVEFLDHIWCVSMVFRCSQLVALGVLLNPSIRQGKAAQSFAMVINPAVEDMFQQ